MDGPVNKEIYNADVDDHIFYEEEIQAYEEDHFPEHLPEHKKTYLKKFYKAVPEEFYSHLKRAPITPKNCLSWLEKAKQCKRKFHLWEVCSGSSRLSLLALISGLTVCFPVDMRYGWDVGYGPRRHYCDESMMNFYQNVSFALQIAGLGQSHRIADLQKIFIENEKKKSLHWMSFRRCARSIIDKERCSWSNNLGRQPCGMFLNSQENAKELISANLVLQMKMVLLLDFTPTEHFSAAYCGAMDMADLMVGCKDKSMARTELH